METLRAVNYWRACWRTCLELDRAACHMITSAQWQFGFFIKRSHCPLWLIERVGGVTPHSGGWSCFIYTFFGLGLLSPPLDTPPNTYREEKKKKHHELCTACAFPQRARAVHGLISKTTRKKTAVFIILSYYTRWKLPVTTNMKHLVGLNPHVHSKKGSTSMFKHAHPSPNPLEAVGLREELLFNIPQHDLSFVRLWHNNCIFKRLGRSSSMIGWDLWL